MPELVPGVLVTPAIRLVRKLGAGGMGSVWIGEHSALHTEVVVKFMSDSLGQNGADRARFSREATAASQVRSPHVVQVFDHGLTPDGTPFIVMELLDGEDLGRKIARLGRLALPDVVDLIDQLALALSRVHAARIVHRDVKPANIFVCDRGDGTPFYKLLDFGIAKGSASNMMIGIPTLTGAVVATPAYGSPEQLIGSKSVDHRSDLWSLGLVAFKALTGQLPYHGDSVASLALAIHNGPPPRLTKVVPSLPPAVDDWFARACKVAADDRFQSAQEMAKALAAAAAGAQPATPVLSPATIREAAGATLTSATRVDTTLPIAATKVSAAAKPFAATKMSAGVEPSTEPATMALETTWRPPGAALPRLLVGGAVVVLIAGGAALVASTRHAKTPADVSAAIPSSLASIATTAPAPPPASIPSAAPPASETPPASATASAARKPTPRPTVHVPISPSRPSATVDPQPPAPAPTPTATPTNASKLL